VTTAFSTKISQSYQGLQHQVASEQIITINKTAELVLNTVFSLHICIKKVTKCQNFEKLNNFEQA